MDPGISSRKHSCILYIQEVQTQSLLENHIPAHHKEIHHKELYSCSSMLQESLKNIRTTILIISESNVIQLLYKIILPALCKT